MGWFDVVASKYGCRLQGTTDVAFTVLDVLGYLDEIPVCVAYDIDGEITTDFPPTYLLERAKPVLETLPGWKCDIRGIKRYEDLPETVVDISNLLRRRSVIRLRWFLTDREEMRSSTAKKAGVDVYRKTMIQT